MKRVLAIILGLGLLLPASAAAQAKRSTQDRCIVSSNPNYLIVFQDVPTLNVLRTIPLRGAFGSGEGSIPLDGSAILERDGSVRIGFFVHGSVLFPYNWTISGYTDGNFAGVLRFDFDGDFRPESSVVFEPVDCDTVFLPY